MRTPASMVGCWWLILMGIGPASALTEPTGSALAAEAVGLMPSTIKEPAALLGNGDLGVMMRPRTSGEINFVLGKADYWGVMNGSITNVGSLLLKSPQLNGATFQMEQRIGPATVTGNFTAPSGVALESSMWVDKNDNLLVVELANSGKIPLEFSGLLSTSRGGGIPANCGSTDDSTWLHVGADASSWLVGNRNNWRTRLPFVGQMAGIAIYDQALLPDQTKEKQPLLEATAGDKSLLHGKAAWTDDPQKGPVVDLAGEDATVVLGDAQLPAAFTIDLWVKPTQFSKDNTVFAAVNIETKDQGRYPFIRGFLLNLIEGRPVARFNFDRVSAPAPLPLNAWSRLTVSYGGCQLVLSANGREVGRVAMRPRDMMGWDKTAFRPGDPMMPHEGLAPFVMLRQRVLGTSPTVQGRELRVKLAPGEKATWLLAAVTDRNTKDYKSASAALVASNVDGLTKRRAAHQAAWRDFWNRSFVEIPDKKIQNAYYGALYLLACCSRPETPPPGLWYNFIPGIGMPWDGDYTLNYNFQAPFWAAYATNHFELADNYDNYLLGQIEDGRAVAQNAWHIDPKSQPAPLEALLALRDTPRPEKPTIYDGIYLYTHLMPGPGWSNDYGTFWGQKSNALFCAVNMVHRWRLDPDPAYAWKVYPFLREVALFWDSFLVLKDGHYQVIGDAVNEGSGHDINPSTTLSYLRLLYPSVMEMSLLLNQDVDRRPVWKERLDKLSSFLFVSAESARLRLGVETLAGRTIIRGSEEGAAFPAPMVDVYKKERKERTSSSGQNTTQTIFPGLSFGLESPPEELKAARDSVYLAAQWWDRNNTCSFYPAAAAVGHDPTEILENLRVFLTGTQQPNFTIDTSGGGTETVAVVPATLAMMMLQSHQGVLHVFPNWPVTQDARFGGLNAQGGFLVSGSIKNGVIEPVAIQSHRGRECVLKNPWPGRAVQVLVNGQPLAQLTASDLLRVATLPNQTLTLKPQ